MEAAVLGGGDGMRLPLTRDVMHLMSSIRRDWGMYYEHETTLL